RNANVLRALLDEFAGQVALIYIDPPFATGADFTFSATVPDSDTNFSKQPSIIEQKAYRDTWGKRLDSYLQWLADTANLLAVLLSPTGSLYVHLDWRAVHYAKGSLMKPSPSTTSRTRSSGVARTRTTTLMGTAVSTTRSCTTGVPAVSSI